MSPRMRKSPQKSADLARMEKTTGEMNLLAMMHSRVPKGFIKFFSFVGKGDAVTKRLQKGGDVKISLLLLLSEKLNENLLDYYIQILPENCRQTVQTRQLNNEKLELQKQLDASNLETNAWKERCLRAEEMLRGRVG